VTYVQIKKKKKERKKEREKGWLVLQPCVREKKKESFGGRALRPKQRGRRENIVFFTVISVREIGGSSMVRS